MQDKNELKELFSDITASKENLSPNLNSFLLIGLAGIRPTTQAPEGLVCNLYELRRIPNPHTLRGLSLVRRENYSNWTADVHDAQQNDQVPKPTRCNQKRPTPCPSQASVLI